MEAFSEGLLMVGVYFLSFSFILLRSIVVYLKSGSWLTFFLYFFLNFLQKYRCVPKIGFSADISIGILIDISIGILTDKEEGGGRKEGGREWTFP